jgi:membrane protein
MAKPPFISALQDRSRWPSWAHVCFHYINIYWQDASRSQLTTQASAMAYVTLFSLVPSLAAIFTLLGLFLPMLGDNSNLMNEGRQFLFKYLATGSGTLVVEHLEKFISDLNLRRIGASAFVGLLVTLVILLHQIEDAFNRIWMIGQARKTLTRFIYFWLFITLGMFSISILIGLSTNYSATAFITKKTLAAADRAESVPILSMLFNWAFVSFIFFLAYKVIPNCEVRSRAARVGALVAGTLFYVISKWYGAYVTSFASYKTIYGTLAAIPIFLLWIYLCWVILLSGALFAWRWQTGWPPLHEEKTLESTDTCADGQRNLGIRTILPSITLLAIYERFRDGKPTDVTSIVEDLKLPFGWVHESIEFLKESGLVATAQVAQQDKTTAEQILPTHPAEAVSLSRLVDLSEAPISTWFEAWEPDTSKSLKSYVALIKSKQFEKGRDSIGSLMKTQAVL